MEDPEALAAVIGDHLRFATESERLGCAISAMKLPLEFIGEMAKGDPELAPELSVAVDHIGQATLALSRAHQFTRTRLEVRTALALGLDPTEGGTPA